MVKSQRHVFSANPQKHRNKTAAVKGRGTWVVSVIACSAEHVKITGALTSFARVLQHHHVHVCRSKLLLLLLSFSVIGVCWCVLNSLLRICCLPNMNKWAWVQEYRSSNEVFRISAFLPEYLHVFVPLLSCASVETVHLAAVCMVGLVLTLIEGHTAHSQRTSVWDASSPTGNARFGLGEGWSCS